jgi:drug/metabolite transporter (DMT)-like permease
MGITQHLKSERTPAILAILTVTGIWGLAGPVIVWTLKLIPPFTFLFLRFLTAAIVVLPFAVKAKFWREINRQNLPTLLGLSLLGTTLGLAILFYGYQFTTALDGSLISLLAPLLIIAGGAVFLKEEITGREKLGLAIAFAGSIVTLAQPVLERGAAGEKAALGNLLILLYHISWAAYALWNKKTGKKFSTLTMTAFPIFISVPVFAPLALVEYHRFPSSILHPPSSIFYSRRPLYVHPLLHRRLLFV